MRQALRKGDYKSLNIYILKELPKGNAGVSAPINDLDRFL